MWWWSVVETEDRQCPVSPGGQLTVDNMAGLEGVTLVNITIALLKLDIKSWLCYGNLQSHIILSAYIRFSSWSYSRHLQVQLSQSIVCVLGITPALTTCYVTRALIPENCHKTCSEKLPLSPLSLSLQLLRLSVIAAQRWSLHSRMCRSDVNLLSDFRKKWILIIVRRGENLIRYSFYCYYYTFPTFHFHIFKALDIFSLSLKVPFQ